MKCLVCGDDDLEHRSSTTLSSFVIEHSVVCSKGHTSKTVEVPSTMLASKLHREYATAALNKRISRWHRNVTIQEENANGSSPKDLAQKYGVTEMRVMQILKHKERNTNESHSD